MTTKRAIAIGILTITLVGLISYAVKYIKTKATTPNANNTIISAYADDEQIKFDASNYDNITWYVNETQQNTNIFYFSAGDTIEYQRPSGRTQTLSVGFFDNNNNLIDADTWYGEINQANVTQQYMPQGTKTIVLTDIDDNSSTQMNYLGQILYSGDTPTPPTPTPTGSSIEEGNFTSLQELMLYILTMPFTFISQAFNVTLWPNTSYSFNIGNFIISIIAILTILFIIKVFTSGFSILGNYTRQQNTISKTRLNNARTEKIKKDSK